MIKIGRVVSCSEKSFNNPTFLPIDQSASLLAHGVHRWYIDLSIQPGHVKCTHLSLDSLFGWLVADGWCWFVLREKYCWLVAGGWFVLREKYCWLVADKPSEQAPLGTCGPAV
jgi:hypothetical protein